MTISATAVVALLIFGWSVASGALSRRNITGPLVFAVAGYLLANPDWGPVPVDVDESSIHVAAEITLALLLFSDAARVNVHELRRDAGLPVRLLGIALPLSVVAGAGIAVALFDLPWALAGFVGAALAPTDAALSAQVIDDERVPIRLRRTLNVESGLNDGIVTPVVSVTLAMAASQLGVVAESVSFEFGTAMWALGIGILAGATIGTVGALVLNQGVRRDWIAPGGRRLATLALALAAFTVTVAFDGNGFIAAFVAGAAFGAATDRQAVDLERVNELPEMLGELLALLVWFLFGATLLPIVFHHADGRVVLYTMLSLTAIRMAPVALSLIGTRLDRPTIAFIAWFGPRGLASIVFAILALEQLGDSSPDVQLAIATVTATIAASVLLHGITAGPGARRYLQLEHDQQAHIGPRSRRSSLLMPARRQPRPAAADDRDQPGDVS